MSKEGVVEASRSSEEIITTACASHCGSTCLLRVHVRNGVIIRIETDDGKEPQLRACLKGRAYRQRVYAPDRLLYPMKRAGERGEGKFERISWDEAIDTVARQLVRVRDTYGPASLLFISKAGDGGMLHNKFQTLQVLTKFGGCTLPWSLASFQAGVYAQWLTYGTYATSNTRDDLLNSRLIIMWGWNPVVTQTGVNTSWYLARARESGIRIVAVDPKYTESAATFAHEWIPIRPGTDGAMLLAMAHTIMESGLENKDFLDKFTVGYDKFKDYVLGKEDGVAKTPAWAEEISGVKAGTIAELARAYATVKPAALMAGIAPGRTAYGEQYHRIAITLAAMTGNIGIHGGDAAGRAWESIIGGYPFKLAWGSKNGKLSQLYESNRVNPVDAASPPPPPGAPFGYRPSSVHELDIPDFIERGKAGGYPADCKLIGVVNCSYVNAYMNLNRITKALNSGKVEFIFVQEQKLTPTTRFADIVLPTNTFLERNDFALGVGHAYYGYQMKCIESIGESKSQLEIASLLAARLGLSDPNAQTEEEHLQAMVASSEIPDYHEFKRKGVFWIACEEPYVALKKQIQDPAGNPFPTPSGKIEIFSQRLADLDRPDLPPIPKYIETWESRNDPLAKRYPLQMITPRVKVRANRTYHNVPWLTEVGPQVVTINSIDAKARGIKTGDMVRVFNDRGTTIIPAKVTERIMPGVVEVPDGAWHLPDGDVDRGGCSNVLTNDVKSPGGAWPTNTCLVQVEKE